MVNRKMMWSLFAAGSMAVSLCAADAPAAAPAEKAAAPAEAEKPVDIWSGIPEVVATVNGKAITRADVEAAIKAQLPNGQIPPMFTADVMKQIVPGVVKQMIQKSLIAEAAAKAGIKVDETAAKAELEKLVKGMSAEQLEMLKKTFTAEGTTIEAKINEMAGNPQFREQLAENMFIEKMLADVKPVTEAEAQKFYNDNPQYFERGELIVTSHILYPVEGKDAAADKAAADKAAATYDKLKADPSQFEAIAKTDSSCPSGKEGGKLQGFEPGKGQMDKDFETAAVALKEKGQLSAPVKTRFGYHIIRLEEIIPAGKVSFADVKAEIEQSLSMQRKQEAFSKLMAKLMESNKVEMKMAAPAAMQMPMM